MLEDYLDEFETLASSLESRLKSISEPKTDHEEFICHGLKELKYYYHSADVLLRNLPRDAQTQYARRHQQHRMQYDALQRQWLLIGQPPAASTNAGTTQHAMDLESTTKLSEHKLQEALRAVTDSEQMGIQILTNLQEQRETLVKSQANVAAVGHCLNDSENVVSRMSRWWNQFL